jgi:ribonuclease HI
MRPPQVRAFSHNSQTATETLDILSPDDDEVFESRDSAFAAHREEFRKDFDRAYPYPPLVIETNPSHQEDRLSQSHSCYFPFTEAATAAKEKVCEPSVAAAAYSFDGAFSIDGGCVNKTGSCAFVGYYNDKCDVQSYKIAHNTTNNYAEFKTLLTVLRLAIAKQLKRILIITDSMLVAKYLRGTLQITQKQLLALTNEMIHLFPEFDAVYVSRIPSHQDVSLENDVADCLCSWNIANDAPISHYSDSSLFIDSSTLSPITKARIAITSKYTPMSSLLIAFRNKASTKASCPNSLNTGCEYCTLPHSANKCPLQKFAASDFTSGLPCCVCLSPLHNPSECPLMRYAEWRPALSKFTPNPILNSDDAFLSRTEQLFNNDFAAIRFPNNCSRKQFLDYFVTVFASFDAVHENDQASQPIKAVQAFRNNFYFQGQCIRRVRHRTPNYCDPGDNSNPLPKNKELDRARRALRAALLLPKARIADVSKALRTGERVPLTQDIIDQLHQCYPQASEEEKTIFEPRPLRNFVADRHAVARAIMSRSPSSHPGYAGLSFDILQNYCRWTYLSELPDSPDPRWDVLVKLISKIMSGNATALSDFLLDVVGAFFNKNAEKIGTPFALRNLGIEESLMRISAALVFETVLPLALQQQFLTDFDLGAGRKTGAEVFGRLAALFAAAGAPIAVFDIIKAFNNLRRCDIKAAVEAFNHPLLTAFVHFMFSRDSKVTFSCPLTGNTLCVWLTKGIHQGNPLSVFIFCLTIAFILKPFRNKYPQALIPAFVDDLVFSMPAQYIHDYPIALDEFISLFKSHGLCFDLSDSAKSSVFSTEPLPENIRLRIQTVGLRCQTDGVAPCKVPTGSPSFMTQFVDKLAAKLRLRFRAFQDLLPALLALDKSRKTPSHHNLEHFLNLVRLSFLSMPTYALRTVIPSYCAAYRQNATEMALSLINSVFPPFIHLPPSPTPNLKPYPDFAQVSRRIMQLPLTLGGLSLRMADTVGDIAYAASCTDCLPLLKIAATRFNFPAAQDVTPELSLTRTRIAIAVPSINDALWIAIENPDADALKQPLQHFLTTLLNAAEVESIASLLKPWPVFYHAFRARTDKMQLHVSWPLNPKTRAFYRINMLPDAEFSRSIAISTMHPLIAPRTCACGSPIDPVGFHLLHCKHSHYGCLHDRVKFAVAARIRSFMHTDAAAFSVLTEQPMLQHFGLRNAALPEGPALICDLLVSMHSELQQEPIACDFVSCFAADKRDYPIILNAAARFKNRKYHKYNFITDKGFFPLPFGRTNIISNQVLRFCSLIGNYMPPHMRASDQLIATFSRAIYSGVAQTVNVAIRRLQLSAAQCLPLAQFPFASLRQPYVEEPRSRSAVRGPRHPPYADVPLVESLAAVLAASSPEATVWPVRGLCRRSVVGGG